MHTTNKRSDQTCPCIIRLLFFNYFEPPKNKLQFRLKLFLFEISDPLASVSGVDHGIGSNCNLIVVREQLMFQAIVMS